MLVGRCVGRAVAAARNNGRITHYTGQLGLGGTGRGAGITVGPDGAMWFTNPVTNTIGRITTKVTPEIFRKRPRSGAPGTEVTIIGRNLSPATQVAFNGTPAKIVSDSGTYVVAIVPPGATTGRIAVTTPAGTATKNGWFIVTQAAHNDADSNWPGKRPGSHCRAGHRCASPELTASLPACRTSR